MQMLNYGQNMTAAAEAMTQDAMTYIFRAQQPVSYSSQCLRPRLQSGQKQLVSRSAAEEMLNNNRAN